MSLRERLIDEVARDGPISVANYMMRCLHDPRDGYYATRPALGPSGDFITAPLVSQIFGEVLAAWTHEVWTSLGRPRRLRLAELGPGDGTLMSDVLRCLGADPSFLASCEPWLVEISEPLRTLQLRLVGHASWARELGQVPTDAPMVILANEFLDCLPVHQWIGGVAHGVERRITLNANGDLEFESRGGGGEIWEDSPAVRAVADEVAHRVLKAGGAALFIDYGFDQPKAGDTLQALRGHCKEHPLANPGLADLTAHVDFAAFAEAAAKAGARVAPIETQRSFLMRLGAGERATALARARPDRADTIARQLHRLTSNEQMGDLFKVAVLTAPGLTPP